MMSAAQGRKDLFITMKRWVFSFLIIVAGCSPEDTLRRVCPAECYPEWMPEEQIDVGVCSSGTPVCDEENVLVSCEFDKKEKNYLMYEVCDGLDNDCDGFTDESVGPRQSQYFQHEPNPCLEELGSMLGECKHALVECVDGQYVCNTDEEWLDIEIGEETICDEKDNNCNGRIDDIEISCTDLLGNPTPCTCYEGPIGSEQYGQCDVGYYECVFGNIVCNGQVVPSIELCDSLDNDCNGIIDDTGDTLNTQYDIVFVVDTSGSMCSYISAVAAALNEYVIQFEDNPNFQFAIVLMSSYGDQLVTIEENFTDLGTIQSKLLLLGCNGSGSEGSLDSMAMVCDDLNPLGLSWREDANRLFFMFTDEPPQTYESPEVTEFDVVDFCLNSFTLPFIWHNDYPEFSHITDNANGLDFQLRSQWQPIFDDLNSIVITLCGADE